MRGWGTLTPHTLSPLDKINGKGLIRSAIANPTNCKFKFQIPNWDPNVIRRNIT